MKTHLINMFRWILAFPGALVAAWIAWFFIYQINKYTMIWYLDTFNFQERLLVEFMSNAAAGVAFIYSFLKIVPKHYKALPFILAVIVIFVSGILATFAFKSNDWWAIFGIFSLVVGAGFTIYKSPHANNNY